MTDTGTIVSRWKSPDDFKRWLSKRFDRFVAAELREPSVPLEEFQISTPELSAGAIAEHFAAVRAWANVWLSFASEFDLTIEYMDWETRNFGRIRIPKKISKLSIDRAAIVLDRSRSLQLARERFRAIVSADARLADLAGRWSIWIKMAPEDFSILGRFLAQVSLLGVPRMRLREVPCAGMHTKFLEQHGALLVPALSALGIAPEPNAKTWAGKLGFIEDETQQFELKDLDGQLLPFRRMTLPVSQLLDCPIVETIRIKLAGVLIVENQATFRALPTIPGLLAIFGQGDAVRTLGRAQWLAERPLLYSGDLDHAGYLMVASMRRDGLNELETILMDLATANAFKDYWVKDTSRPGPEPGYDRLTSEERSAQRLMATGPWRLEQERIPFDLWIENVKSWRHSKA